MSRASLTIQQPVKYGVKMTKQNRIKIHVKTNISAGI